MDYSLFLLSYNHISPDLLLETKTIKSSFTFSWYVIVFRPVPINIETNTSQLIQIFLIFELFSIGYS